MMFSNKILQFANAIQDHEGWIPANPKNLQGSRSWRNHNAGNLRYSPYTKSLGAIGKDKDGFCLFKTCDDGYNALCQLITDAANNELRAYHDCNIKSFFSIYAPDFDKNNSLAYAQFVANKLGIPITTTLKSLL